MNKKRKDEDAKMNKEGRKAGTGSAEAQRDCHFLRNKLALTLTLTLSPRERAW